MIPAHILIEGRSGHAWRSKFLQCFHLFDHGDDGRASPTRPAPSIIGAHQRNRRHAADRTIAPHHLSVKRQAQAPIQEFCSPEIVERDFQRIAGIRQIAHEVHIALPRCKMPTNTGALYRVHASSPWSRLPTVKSGDGLRYCCDGTNPKFPWNVKGQRILGCDYRPRLRAFSLRSPSRQPSWPFLSRPESVAAAPLILAITGGGGSNGETRSLGAAA